MERNNLPLVSLSDQKQLYSSIKHALVCGFPMQVAYRPGEQESYLTVKDHQVCLVSLLQEIALNDQCTEGKDPPVFKPEPRTRMGHLP